MGLLGVILFQLNGCETVSACKDRNIKARIIVSKNNYNHS
jgi:hypothetical protein